MPEIWAAVQTWAGAISALAATFALVGAGVGSFLGARKRDLRREEVLIWSNEVIEILEALYLLCIIGTETDYSEDRPLITAEGHRSKLSDVIFRTGVAIEQGRIFFKNDKVDNFGEERPSAYQGYRPRILDHIVVAHQIARGWQMANEETKARMRCVAQDSLHEFVSLAQQEVGRSRAACAAAIRGGNGANLPSLLNKVAQNRLPSAITTQPIEAPRPSTHSHRS